MTERVFVTPAADRKVRHPDNPSKHIKAGGEWVARSVGITRRIAAGDLIEGEPKPVAKAAPAKTETVKD